MCSGFHTCVISKSDNIEWFLCKCWLLRDCKALLLHFAYSRQTNIFFPFNECIIYTKILKFESLLIFLSLFCYLNLKRNNKLKKYCLQYFNVRKNLIFLTLLRKLKCKYLLIIVCLYLSVKIYSCFYRPPKPGRRLESWENSRNIFRSIEIICW